MRYFCALVLSASLFLPAMSASANVLTPADYQSFQDLDVKMLSIGDDLYSLITTRPEAHAPDCLMQLPLSSTQCKPIYIGYVRWWELPLA
jgi:hypothetical protein